MTINGIQLQLELGAAVPGPAPKYVVEKLRSVQVTQADDKPVGFQLVFNADRTKGLTQDYPLLSSPLLKPSTRVVLSVALNGHSTILIDGFITHQELSHRRDFGVSTLTITGEDVSVLMDLLEISFEYPQLGDSMIAEAVLAKFALIGIVPEVIPTLADLIPEALERTPQQNSTDRCYLKQLAAAHGYLFYVRPGPVKLTNIAYWGPPVRIGTVGKALTVGAGPLSNVESINFTLDALAPTLVDGWVQDTLSEDDLPITTFTSTRFPRFATRPALGFAKLFERRILFTDPRYGILQALADGQAVTDVSTDRVVVGSGEVETVRYGAIMQAPSLVAVRGVGQSYDGKYYVQSVTHNISRDNYKQSFTLTREGVGSTIERVNA